MSNNTMLNTGNNIKCIDKRCTNMYNLCMAYNIRFNEEKNQILQVTRGVNFEAIIESIQNGGLLADIIHPSKSRPRQRVLVVKLHNYAFAVPYAINKTKNEIFLKTIYPSRSLTKIYIKGASNE
jgi:hypothetical protein